MEKLYQDAMSLEGPAGVKARETYLKATGQFAPEQERERSSLRDMPLEELKALARDLLGEEIARREADRGDSLLAQGDEASAAPVPPVAVGVTDDGLEEASPLSAT